MGKTAMKHLIEKINRMPETSIKNFIKLLGHEYLIKEKEQLLDFFMIGQDIGTSIEDAEETYNEMYGNANE